MSNDEPRAERWITNWVLIYCLPPAIIGAILALYLYVGRTPEGTRPTGPTGPTQVNQLDAARTALTRGTDLAACRSALQQINAYLAREPRDRPPPLGTDQAARLEKLFGLDKGARAEIAEAGFTRLDAYHLDRCFLMRDAAHSLAVRGVRGRSGRPLRPTPVEQASAAFAWVVRQVRQQERPGGSVPPAFVLRRGWGTALERALIFLALLEQVGDEGAAAVRGCLVSCPGKDGAARLWACGVLVGERPDVYLFDPRLGLPLPGPGGRGVATLAEVCGNPAVLGQLNLDDKHRYDVTPEQARKAELILVCPLSALAPRMRVLQDQLLPPVVRVRLAREPEKDLAALKAAADAPGVKGVTVSVRKGVATLLRSFLPSEEGGTDKGLRYARFNLDLAPWEALPAVIRDNPRLGASSTQGQRLRELFVGSFIDAVMKPGKARDLVLRGRFAKATPELSMDLSVARDEQKLRLPTEGLEQAVQQWAMRAQGAYAAHLRARGSPEALAEASGRVAELWAPNQPVPALLITAVARQRAAGLTYQLGLCMHEQAKRGQARLDLAARAGGEPPSEADRTSAREAWEDARNWWKRFGEEYGSRPEAAAARRLRGEAEAMLGNSAAAAAAWQDLSGVMTPLEQVASLYLARPLKK